MAEPTSAHPYDKAYNLAVEKLASANLEEVAFNTSAQLEGDTLKLNFLGETFQVTEKGKKIYRLGGLEEVNPVRSVHRKFTNGEKLTTDTSNGVKMAEKIIILHYLVTADGAPPAPGEVAFPNIPGSAFYYPTFKARTMDLLERVFQNETGKFLVISQGLGARIAPMLRSGSRLLVGEPTAIAPGVNHGSAQFLALPNVPITLLYWNGAEQLPPSSQVLYNANITHYLPLEDIVVITELLVHKIIKQAKETSSRPVEFTDGHLYESR